MNSVVRSPMNLEMKLSERTKTNISSLDQNSVYVFCIPSRDSGPTPIPYLSDGKYYELSRFDKHDWTWFITSKSTSFDEEEFEEITGILNKILSHPLYRSVLPIMSDPHNLYQTRKMLERLDVSYEQKSGTFLCDERKDGLVSSISDVFSEFINDETEMQILSWFLLNDKNLYSMLAAVKEIAKIRRQSGKMVNGEIMNEAIILAKTKMVNRS